MEKQENTAKLERALPLNPSNPSPFRQPFLVIRFKDKKYYTGIADGWHVDVGGKIEKYIEGCDPMSLAFAPPANNMDRATPLMQAMLVNFQNRGMEVEAITAYVGSAGPSHILRNGAFFKRINL